MKSSAHRARAARVIGLAVVGCLAAAPALRAQQASDPSRAARTFELRARDGLERQFESGYRRHLDWHVTNGDPWAWYMWQVIDGPRVGTYIDGTFGHEWQAFDAPVNPAGDLADNALNIDAFATRLGIHTWRLRADLSAGEVDLEGAPFVAVSEHRLRPGDEAELVGALRRTRAGGSPRPYLVLELVSGGELPTYVIWTPVRSSVELGSLAPPIVAQAADRTRGGTAGGSSVRRELWRFRPDLSICRGAATKCHRVVADSRR